MDRDLRDRLLLCCGSQRWVEQMAARWPFANQDELFSSAALIWRGLQEEDWKEAFSAHPKIGAKRADGLAQREQAGAATADSATLERLAKGNKEYLKKFGFIFIVCATGKSGREMLALLEQRLKNDPAKELRIAAGEQEKITRLRLEKIL